MMGKVCTHVHMHTHLAHTPALTLGKSQCSRASISYLDDRTQHGFLRGFLASPGFGGHRWELTGQEERRGEKRRGERRGGEERGREKRREKGRRRERRGEEEKEGEERSMPTVHKRKWGASHLSFGFREGLQAAVPGRPHND